jgi:hypothetical protein
MCQDGPAGSTAFAAASCDGNGNCGSAIGVSCGTYKCGGSVCKDSCQTSNDCISTAYCGTSQCLSKQGSGSPCTANEQCLSGTCSGNFCQ